MNGMLNSLIAGGQGINFQEAEIIVLWDRSYDATVNTQASSRALRLTSTKNVNIYRNASRNALNNTKIQIKKWAKQYYLH